MARKVLRCLAAGQQLLNAKALSIRVYLALQFGRAIALCFPYTRVDPAWAKYRSADFASLFFQVKRQCFADMYDPEFTDPVRTPLRGQ